MKLDFCNIEVTKDINRANCITHSGTFHADEVFATVLLSLILDNINILRINEVDESKIYKEAIIYDVGLGELDHHQAGGNGKRNNGIPYAACGLIWKKYGVSILENIGISNDNIDYLFNKIDKNLIQFIDANDNGITPSIKTDYKYISLASIIASFNPNWDEDVDADIRFIDAINLARIIVKNEFESEISKLKAKSKVENAINCSENDIMILDEFMPWKEFILESNLKKAKDILYVVFPSNRGGYNVYAVPKEEGSFENRKSFPKEWAGLRDENLQKVTGVKTARFCHTACFICTAQTKDDAIKLAILAKNN
ncbi:MAG: MYG1 family protein [Clostridia bacterium]